MAHNLKLLFLKDYDGGVVLDSFQIFFYSNHLPATVVCPLVVEFEGHPYKYNEFVGLTLEGCPVGRKAPDALGPSCRRRFLLEKLCLPSGRARRLEAECHKSKDSQLQGCT